MRILLSFIFIVLAASLQAQEATKKDCLNDTAIVKSFIEDLADENKAIDVILSQHILVKYPSDELYDYLEASLTEIRINLMTKKMEDIMYISYNNMPQKEVKDIDPEALDTNKMYFLNYKKRQMLAVYIESGKIGSFTLVSKGGNKAHFVRY